MRIGVTDIQESSERCAQSFNENYSVPRASIMETLICWFSVLSAWLESHNGAIVAVATVVIALFTVALSTSTKRLWNEAKRTSTVAYRAARTAKRSADIAEFAMVAGERAYVFSTGFKQYWEKIPETGLYNWHFRPIWENRGDTPTKHMTMHTECVLRDTILPADFDFGYFTSDIGTVLIPPNTNIAGSLAPRFPNSGITPEDILEIQAGRKFLFIWGWAKYFDVFPRTPQHITRFCWQITPMGDPKTFIPNSQTPEQMLQFDFLHHPKGNCADEECE